MSQFYNNTRPGMCLLFIMILQVVGYGCATTPASHFYLLGISGQASTDSPATTDQGETVIGIGPIRLPEYLDRPQIVTRSDNTELYISDLNRWAEPLQENFTRVFAEQISRMMATENIQIEPSRNRNDLDYRILANVTRFDANQFGEVILVAYWSVEDKAGSTRLNTRKSTIQLDISAAPGYSEIVEGLSRAVYLLAREISVELNKR
jgi:uncharacterized protein